MSDFCRTMLSIIQQRMASLSETAATARKPVTRAARVGAALLSLSSFFSSSTIVAAGDVAGTVPTDFQIPAASLADALSKFGSQSGMQVVYAPELARGLKSRALSGRLTVDAALKQLLDGTGLTWSYVNGDTVVLKRANSVETAKKSSDAVNKPAVMAVEEITVTAKIPEILVVGSKILNTDIRRTEDDAQPYVVFEAEEIQRSQATTVEDFLKTRLPMNTTQGINSQEASASLGSVSGIALRGLGTNQTLVLVDGRRMPSIRGDTQADINAIPPAAIERIEVLPATASGIYGGGATGGVVNIILRRDYSGGDLRLTYGNLFDGGASSYRFDGSVGFDLEDGRTRVLISGSRSLADPLLVGDRDFAERGRALQVANNPNAFFSGTTPPAGYTTNIRSQNGANLVLDDGTPLNSPITFVPIGYAGPESDGGTALVGNAGSYNLAAPEDISGARQSLINAPSLSSLLFNVRREFGDRVKAFADVAWLNNEGETYFGSGLPGTVTLPADAPNNPFTAPIVVRFPNVGLSFPFVVESESIRSTLGAIVRLSGDWAIGGDYVWGRSSISTAAAVQPIGDPDGGGPGISGNTALSNGTLDIMRDLNAFPPNWAPYLIATPSLTSGPTENKLNDVTFRFSGPTLDLPGGRLTVSGFAEWREEEVGDAFQHLRSATTGITSVTLIPERSQTALSYYLEGRMPLFSQRNRLPFVHDLEVQASIRRDEYQTSLPSAQSISVPSAQGPLPSISHNTREFETNSYTFGVRYAPLSELSLRASYGTGFLAPTVLNLVSTPPSVVALSITDPRRGNITQTVPNVTRTLGGNPNLTPEHSKSWSVGFIYAPNWASGFRLSLDYTRIVKEDEIVSNLSVDQILSLEDIYPLRVVRDPLAPADAALGYTAGVITDIDQTAINLSAAEIEAYDFQVDYTWESAFSGSLRLFAIATWQPTLARQTLPSLPYVNAAGRSSGPLEWRGNAGATWEKGPWRVDWSAQYFDSYRAYVAGSNPAQIANTVLNQGSDEIDGQLYNDLSIAFRFDESERFSQSMLRGTELSFGVQNIFDESPPILATTGTNGGYSTYGDPRMRRYTLTLRHQF